MPDLWSATLNPKGPNYASWLEILGNDKVPLRSSTPIKAELTPDKDFPHEKDVECFLLNLGALTLAQRARLVAFLAQKFGAPIYEIEAEINRVGFPIRAADVIVTHDMRAFV